VVLSYPWFSSGQVQLPVGQPRTRAAPSFAGFAKLGATNLASRASVKYLTNLLSEYLFYRFHWEEEAIEMVREFQKAVLLVESFGWVIFGIDHYCHGSDLPAVVESLF
jgi:hypothetical protein